MPNVHVTSFMFMMVVSDYVVTHSSLRPYFPPEDTRCIEISIEIRDKYRAKLRFFNATRVILSLRIPVNYKCKRGASRRR
jgi:hypothetical protein